MDFKTWLRDTGEKALATLGQHMIVLLPILLGSTDASVLQAAVITLVPALMTVLVNAIPLFRPKVNSWYVDIALRILRTFTATVGGLVVADGFNVMDAASWKSALSVGAVAVTVILKGEIAKRKSNTLSPASLAPA